MSRRVRIALHAQAADLAGAAETAVQIDAEATCADLKRALAETHPRLAALVKSSVMATEREYLAEATPLGDEEQFHLIPPVSGG